MVRRNRKDRRPRAAKPALKGPAASVTLTLDHVYVECQEGGAVLVKCFDIETETLSVWVMRRCADGWDLSVGSVNTDPGHSLAIN